jgi:hypothetical protein
MPAQDEIPNNDARVSTKVILWCCGLDDCRALDDRRMSVWKRGPGAFTPLPGEAGSRPGVHAGSKGRFLF